ncbi:hypothetical protein Purlil1_12972 [Purpureocillium lilacinum]|uniref:Ankyrin repeat protein n=1 Tax=Purpureocillium lilacinum TaxID=33203 RepID=A0ABR0BFC0_PURLI|nr:hypothetical protein Purlil1_12972 [Purpureocillium lilacinum]
MTFCYFCTEFLKTDEWQEHCRRHLSTVKKHCGAITYQHTLIRPAFCPICMQAEDLYPSIRLQYWERDADARKHIELCHGWNWTCRGCDFVADGPESGYSHLHDVHHYNIPKLSFATKTETSTAHTSKALLGPATASVSKAVDSETESWDQLMTNPSSPPSRPAVEATTSPKHSRSTTPDCLPPSVFMQYPDAAEDVPDMSTQLLERTASPDECSTRMQTIRSFVPGEEHLYWRCNSTNLGASDCGVESDCSDLGFGSRPSSPATADSPCTPPTESAIDFASYASDALFVLDAMDASMTDDDGECGDPLPSSPKTPCRGSSPSMEDIAPAIVDEEPSELAAELPQASPVCVLHEVPVPKRPRIKLRLRPTSGGAPCSVTDRPQSVLSASKATARPRVRITLKTGSFHCYLDFSVGLYGDEINIAFILASDSHNTAIDAVEEDGRTPLSHAAEAGHNVVVRLLLDRGAPIDSIDKDGQTPLSHAAETREKAVMQLPWSIHHRTYGHPSARPQHQERVANHPVSGGNTRKDSIYRPAEVHGFDTQGHLCLHIRHGYFTQKSPLSSPDNVLWSVHRYRFK